MRHYRDLFDIDSERYGLFRWGSLQRGIHVNGVASACWFVSPALTDEDVERTCEAIDDVFRGLV